MTGIGKGFAGTFIIRTVSSAVMCVSLSQIGYSKIDKQENAVCIT